ncbi:MAG: PARP-type zinc finger-containing protein [Candidatus Hodarchaeales archaeon]
MTFKLTKKYENSFWINTSTFQASKGQIGDHIPAEAIIIKPDKETLPNSMIIDVVKCYMVDNSGKINQVTKKEASAFLLERMREFMVRKKAWPPFTGIKQVYKNGNVKIEYNPAKKISFFLKIPSKIADTATEDFLRSLDISSEQETAGDSWALRSCWINPLTMMIKQKVEDIPDEEVVVIEERGYQDGISGKFELRIHYYAAQESSVREITEKEAKEILADQLHDFAVKYGKWPSTAKMDAINSDNTVSVSFKPSKDLNLKLLLTEKHETDIEGFVNSLKSFDEVVREAESKMIWKIEHAKSSRASCRECGEKIVKGELRIGEPSMYMEHLSYKWFHVDCAGRRNFYLVPVTGLDILTPEEREEFVRLGLIDE